MAKKKIQSVEPNTAELANGWFKSYKLNYKLEQESLKGYAAIIIQSSAGTGKVTDYNKRILKRNTLLASVKMPEYLFIGKSSVQTYIYVFRVKEARKKDDIVKFIDFSNDGYTRTNRKKTNCNLRDTDHAKERYDEVVSLVRFGKGKQNYLTEKEYYDKGNNINYRVEEICFGKTKLPTKRQYHQRH